jgi:hypothetical protein
MPNLNAICTIINNAMIADQFASRRFQACEWDLIANTVLVTGEGEDRYEMQIIDNSGEGKTVTFDDVNSIQVYHKIESLKYNIPDSGDYGIPGTWKEEIAEMKMIFFGSRRKAKARPEDIAAAAMSDFPMEISKADTLALGLQTCRMELGEIEMNPYTVWEEEFSGVTYPLDTDTYAFSIKYNIVTTFTKTCFRLC